MELLAPILLECLKSDDFSEYIVSEVIGMMEPMRRDQNRARSLRDAFLTEMSDDELDEVFEVWSRPEVTELIDQVGDIEQPIPLGMRLLRDIPEFRGIAKKAAKAVLWG